MGEGGHLAQTYRKKQKNVMKKKLYTYLICVLKLKVNTEEIFAACFQKYTILLTVYYLWKVL